jgi:hypothetical protein
MVGNKMTKSTRYFGLVRAEIDDQERSLVLKLKRLGNRRHDLGKGHQRWCLDWALSQLAAYRQNGYALTIEAASG